MKVNEFISGLVREFYPTDRRELIKRQIEIVLCDFFGLERYELCLENPELGAEDIKRFKNIYRRIENGEPVEYILGNAIFYGLKLNITRDVLVPRQETEVLVEYVIKRYGSKSNVYFCELGVGSGNIAVAIAKYIDCKIVGVDISIDALKVALRNCRMHEVDNKVFLIAGSWWRPLKEIEFDAIIANPPYVSRGELECLDRSVREYEPLVALDGGEDGLDMYRVILEKAHLYLRPQGEIVFEIGWNRERPVRKLIQNTGYFHDIEVLYDGLNHPRVVIARRM